MCCLAGSILSIGVSKRPPVLGQKSFHLMDRHASWIHKTASDACPKRADCTEIREPSDDGVPPPNDAVRGTRSRTHTRPRTTLKTCDRHPSSASAPSSRASAAPALSPSSRPAAARSSRCGSSTARGCTASGIARRPAGGGPATAPGMVRGAVIALPASRCRTRARFGRRECGCALLICVGYHGLRMRARLVPDSM